jgi:hypothetical protein
VDELWDWWSFELLVNGRCKKGKEMDERLRLKKEQGSLTRMLITGGMDI